MNGNDDLDKELRLVATEVLLSDDMDEGAEHLRKFAGRVAQRMAQVNAQTNAQQRAIDKDFQEFRQEFGMDLLDDPVLFKHMQAREKVLMRAFPNLPAAERWERAARDVIKRYGTADSRVIAGMRQARHGARFATDQQSYQFDTGSDDDFDGPLEEVEDLEIAADRSAAIYGMQVARRGRENKVDKARFNELEVRRRQGNR